MTLDVSLKQRREWDNLDMFVVNSLLFIVTDEGGKDKEEEEEAGVVRTVVVMALQKNET